MPLNRRYAVAAWAVTVADLQSFVRDGAGMFWTFVAPLLCIALFGTLTQPRPFVQAPVALSGATANDAWFADSLRSQRIPVRSGTAPATAAWNAMVTHGTDDLPAVSLGADATPSFEERAVRMAMSASLEDRRAAISLGKAPPPIAFDELRAPVTAASPATGFQRAVPAYLLMFLTINVLAIGSHLVEDRARGRLQRVQVAGGDGVGLVAGKLLARWAIAMVQGAGMFAIGVVAFGIHVAHPIAVAAFVSLYVLAVGAVGILLGAWFRDQEKAQAVAVWGTMVACALGGVWWNVAGDPGVLGTLALCMPTGWGIVALETLSNGGPAGAVWLPCALLAVLAAVAAGMAVRVLRR